MLLACPNCGSTDFLALEQISAQVSCKFERGPDGQIEIEQEAKGEFVREDASSVTVSYSCKGCEFVYQPQLISSMLVEKT